MQTVKSLEESGLLIKDISEIIENEPKEQKDGDLVCARLLRNLLVGKAVIQVSKGTVRAGQVF